MPTPVAVHNLAKSYGPIHAVRDVSFDIAPGEIFGLLGPNGAGKTTTLECIIGLRAFDAGRVEIAGFDLLKNPAEVKERIGVQLQATALHDNITVLEAMRLFASFYRNRADIPALLDRFALTDKTHARFETLSGGQKQRLAVALALVNNPSVLLLDEPTANLDPHSRRELHEIIRRMKSDGHTVLLTTHYIEEAESLCDRVAIIDHGVIIASGAPAELTARSRAHPRLSFRTSAPVPAELLSTLPGIHTSLCDEQSIELSTDHIGQTLVDVVKLLESRNIDLLDLHVAKSSLEDVFIELTGRRIRD